MKKTRSKKINYRRMQSNKTRKNKSLKRVFSKEEYNSGDGMLTSVWGPPMWHFLHTMSFNYPINPTVEDKKNYSNFIYNLRYVLPCKYCRMNLKENFKKKPLTLDTMECRETFSRYIYDLHEHINTMLNKKSGLSYEDVQERYEHFRARCLANQPVPKHKKGCTEPLYGKKSKCIINIVPQEDKTATFQMDEKCIKKRE